MAFRHAALALLAVVALGVLAVSGGSGADPKTPSGLPGSPPPFLGTAVAGGGGLTAAIDAYGDVVDLRAGPASPALIENAADRQAAGTVPAETGIVPRVRVGDGEPRALWEADAVAQRYLPGTNVVRTVARFERADGRGPLRATVTAAVAGHTLALTIGVSELTGPIGPVSSDTPTVAVAVDREVRCRRARQPGSADLLCGVGGRFPASAGALIRAAAAEDRRWLAEARPLGAGAPPWAVAMYQRSLLTLRALTDARTGAAAAGARDGWAYVWPRDAAATALAFAAAGYRSEARRVVRFLRALNLQSAARFHGDGTAVPGRGPQGDATGWTAVAARATGLARAAGRPPASPPPWRELPDYQEGEPGDYLGNALASNGDVSEFSGPIGTASSDTSAGGLFRRAGEPESGLDSAAAWAVRPFARRALYPAARRTLRALVADGTPYGITPGAGWHGGVDPWMAPTAWSAWAFAALAATPRLAETGVPRSEAERAADRRQALALLAALRRAATPAGALPERVDVRTGVPASTTPLAWPHAFAVLALGQLWPTWIGNADGGK